MKLTLKIIAIAALCYTAYIAALTIHNTYINSHYHNEVTPKIVIYISAAQWQDDILRHHSYPTNYDVRKK